MGLHSDLNVRKCHSASRNVFEAFSQFENRNPFNFPRRQDVLGPAEATCWPIRFGLHFPRMTSHINLEPMWNTHCEMSPPEVKKRYPSLRAWAITNLRYSVALLRAPKYFLRRNSKVNAIWTFLRNYHCWNAFWLACKQHSDRGQYSSPSDQEHMESDVISLITKTKL